MNRSFRSQESEMQVAASAEKQREQLRAALMREKEDELAMFLEMWKREKEQSNLLLNNSEEFDDPIGSKPGTSPIFKISSTTPAARKPGSDDFLNSDNDKNDYDWLLTPPGTPLFPSLEMDSQKTVMSQIGTQTTRPTGLKSRLANRQTENISKGNTVSKQAASSPGLNSSIAGSRRPSSSAGPVSSPAMSSGRASLTPTSKTSRSLTPTSRATLPSSRPIVSGTKSSTTASKPTLSAVSKSTTSALSKPTTSAAKPSTSVTKPTTTATKPTVPVRSSTPLSRSSARSSTPTSRPSIPPSKVTSRAATPTRRPSTQSSAPPTSAPPIKSSPSVTKLAPVTARNPVPSRAASPTVKPRLWKPSDMPGFSLEAPPNLRTSLPERPLSATRGRSGAPSSRSSSQEPSNNVRPRRQSCSPSRGRIPNGVVRASGSSVPAVRRHSKVDDNVSPVVIGTKMVERVMNMRKLVPPKQDNKLSPHDNLSGKSSSSPDGSGFGRMLSKKSLDMAIRHMDIRRTVPGNLRPLMTNIPASSMYSVRSGPIRSRTVSVLDSPLATSSNASSEVSVNNNGLFLDGTEVEEGTVCERAGGSPVHGR